MRLIAIVLGYLAGACDVADPCAIPVAEGVRDDVIFPLGTSPELDAFRTRSGKTIAIMRSIHDGDSVLEFTTSDDGLVFEQPRIIANADVDAPTIIERGGEYIAMVSSRFVDPRRPELSVMRSRDGEEWSRPAPALLPSLAGATIDPPDAHGLLRPQLFDDGQALHVYFQAVGSPTVASQPDDVAFNPVSIGHAISRDGGATFEFQRWIAEASPCLQSTEVEMFFLRGIMRSQCGRCAGKVVLLTSGSTCDEPNAYFHLVSDDGNVFDPPRRATHTQGSVVIGRERSAMYFANDATLSVWLESIPMSDAECE